MKRLTGLKQYAEMKAKHPDALLLFRVGNFYEAYRDDASTCSHNTNTPAQRRRELFYGWFSVSRARHLLTQAHQGRKARGHL